MTEPSQPTFTVVETTPEEEVVEVPPVPNAPSYVYCAPHVGTTDVTVGWGQPNEGPADSYLVEIAGASLEVPASAAREDGTFEIVIQGLAAGEQVFANVVAQYEDDAVENVGLATPDDAQVKTYDEGASEVPSDAMPQEA